MLANNQINIKENEKRKFWEKIDFREKIYLEKKNTKAKAYQLKNTVKPVLKWPLSKTQKINAGQKYCRMLIISTFIKLPFLIKIFVLSIFEWPFYTGFTVT